MNFYLLYRSTESYEIDSSGMINLLLDARKKNQLTGITGLLIYRLGCFMQLLEGDEVAVARLYESIARDPRHTGAYILKTGVKDARLFPKWSMAYTGAPLLASGEHPMTGVESENEAIRRLAGLDQRHQAVPAMLHFLTLDA